MSTTITSTYNTSGVSNSTTTSATTTTTKRSTDYQSQFLKLLIAKLANQNPMDIEKQEDFLGQMAQFQSLSEMIKLNTNVSSLTLSQQISSATSLIGYNVSVGADNSITDTGIVKSVKMVDGVPKVVINDKPYGLNEIIGVKLNA